MTSTITDRLRHTNRVALAIAVVVVGALAMAGLIWFVQPDTLGNDEYAATLCTEVLAPLARADDAAAADEDMQKFRDGAARSNRDRERAIAAFSAAAERVNRDVGQLGEFNDAHLMGGIDGRRFQRELNRALDDWSDSYDEARADIEALDPSDAEHLAQKMDAIRSQTRGLMLDPSVQPIVDQLEHDIAAHSAVCATAAASLFAFAPA